jgi:hypothetical protein
MANLPFDTIELQLMQTPPPSRKALEAAAGGQPPAPPKAAEFPLVSARSWIGAILQAAFAPPPSAPLLAFPQESDACDVIRVLYSVEKVEIEVAQSYYAVAVRTKGFPVGADLTEQAKAQAVGSKVLVNPQPLVCTKLGSETGLTFGEREIGPGGPVDPEWPHWFDLLRWWRRGDEIGFVTLKASGGPTREVLGEDEQAARHWFRPVS